MRERGAQDGLAQRRDAARYWAAARRAAPPEEAPAFNAGVGAEGVTEGLYDDGEDPDAGIPDDQIVQADRRDGPDPGAQTPAAAPVPGQPVPGPAAEGGATPDIPARRGRGRPRKAGGPEAPAAAADDADPEDDLDALAREMGMAVTNRGRGQAE